MTGREKFKRFEPIINMIILFFKIFGKKGNKYLLNLFRNTSGVFGTLIRYVIIKNIAKEVGANVSIHPGVFLFNLEKIEFGNNVSIHPMCYIEGAGGINIGNDVSIAHATTLISTNHTWDDDTIPIKYNKETSKPIIINDDVWIGCGVRILSGVELKSRTVVAAGAVVNKSYEPKSLIGGVPSKIIKKI